MQFYNDQEFIDNCFNLIKPSGFIYVRVNHEDKVKHREHIKFNEASFKALFQYRFEEEYLTL
jgi:hypothetical protein